MASRAPLSNRRPVAFEPSAQRKAQQIHSYKAAEPEEPLTTNDLVNFVIESSSALRKQASLLFDSTNLNYCLDLKIQLEHVEKRLQRADTLREKRVIALLCALERLTKWPNNFKTPQNGCQRSSYPRLIKVVVENPKFAQIGIKKLASDESTQKARDHKKKFRETFENFANTKDAQVGPSLSELVKSTAGPRIIQDETSECLRNLYNTLCNFCSGAASNHESIYKANISLSFLKKMPGDDAVTVHIFFLHEHRDDQRRKPEWRETYTRIFMETNENKAIVPFEEAQTCMNAKSVRIAHSGNQILDLCRYICSDQIGRLRLTASSNGLFEEGTDATSAEQGIEVRAPSVPLTRVLSSNSLTKDRERKVLLSYFLAKAAWQFHESDWLSATWTKDTVHFMRRLQKQNALDHRPFLSAGFGTSSLQNSINSSTGRTHLYPKILALGIILLEIELGEPIENHIPEHYLDQNGQERPNARHFSAGGIIESKKWKERPRILKPVREAIEICVKPDTSKLGTDVEKVRENLFKHVVAPFSALFEVMWESSPEQQDLGPFTFEGNNTFLNPDEKQKQTHDAVINNASTAAATYSTAYATFLASPSTIQDSQKWLQEFDNALFYLYRAANQTSLSSESGNKRDELIKSGYYETVKVAIIDTGCNIDHLAFLGPGDSQRDDLIDRWVDYVDETEAPLDEDASQHGTALAALTMRLLPGAKIYIVRIVRDLTGLSEAKANIAKAITRVVGELDVDVVSMSFGFTENVKVIRDAITDAEKNHNVIFFAAANNGGRNEPEMFPAFDDSVISIRGTRHDGSFDDQYNPKSWAHKLGPQYGSLARDVPCGWISNDLTKSGCSIATPIVAAIAAIVIAFVDQDEMLTAFRTVVRTRRGMLSVFRAMADDPEAQRLPLAPWQLFEGNRRPGMLIGHALSNIP